VPSQLPSPSAFPISVKGVVISSSKKVLLLKNERDEWELPGGRIEVSETPEECVAREIHEETRWKVTTGPILDSWMYYIHPAERHVFIVTYGCYPEADVEPVLSHEHKEIGLFTESEVAQLNIPGGYQRSIAAWFADIRRADLP
jgi:ADP-ribose pyrophosphatase YjhB (NUDIX family)